MATMSSTMSTEYAMRDIGQAENLGDITAGRSVYQTHIGTLIQNFLAGEFSGNIPNTTERSWVSCTGRSMNRLSKRADAPDSQASVDETNVYRQGPPTAQESVSPSSIVHPPTASQSTYPTPGETQNSSTRHSTSPAAPSIHQRPVVEPNYLSRQLHELPQLLPRSHPRDLWRSPVGDSRRWYRYSPKQRLFKARLEGPSSRTITLIHVLLFYQKHAEHIASGFMKGHKKTPYEPTSIDQNFVDKVYEINWKPLELKEKGRKKRTEEQDPDFLYKSLKQYHEKLAVVFFDVNEPGDFETVLKKIKSICPDHQDSEPLGWALVGFCNGPSFTESNDSKIQSIEDGIDSLRENERPICFIQCATGNTQAWRLLRDALVVLAVYGRASREPDADGL